MAHLWIQEAGEWGAQRLDEAGFDLAAWTSRRARGADPSAPAPAAARLIQAGTAGSKSWALIASQNSGVCVNSRKVIAGLRVLADRDQIRIGSETQYFSTETLAVVEDFPGSDRPIYCGRCRQQIELGAPAVRCPGCGIWYNQSPDLPCFTYSEKCTFCGYPTALDSGFAWTPEED